MYGMQSQQLGTAFFDMHCLQEVLSQAGISLGDSAPATTISRAIQQGCGGAKPELECCQHCQGNYLESVSPQHAKSGAQEHVCRGGLESSAGANLMLRDNHRQPCTGRPWARQRNCLWILTSAKLWHLQVYTCYDKDFAAVDCKAVTSWGICKGDVTIPLPDRVLSLSTDNLTRTQ